MEDKLVAALRAKFKSPTEAIAALGLDSQVLEETPMLSEAALITKGALFGLLSPKMARGKKINTLALDEIVKGITPENWTDKKRQQVAAKVVAKFKPVLAQDAALDEGSVLEGLPPNSAPPLKPATDQSPEAIMAWMSANCPPEMLAKMQADLGMGGAPGGPPAPPPDLGAPPPPAGPPPGAPPPPPEHKTAPDQDPMAAPPPDMGGGGMPPPPPAGGMPPATDEEEDDDVDKTAMDAAIQKERQNQRDIFAAVERVRPKVGNLNIMAFDSADEVYKTALGILKVPTDNLHPTALQPVFEAQPMPNANKGQAPRPNIRLAADSNAPAVISATEAFPDLLRIGRA